MCGPPSPSLPASTGFVRSRWGWNRSWPWPRGVPPWGRPRQSRSWTAWYCRLDSRRRPGLKDAVADLLALPARALTDIGASRGRTRQVVARLRDFLAGDLSAGASAPLSRGGFAPGQSPAAPPPHKTAATESTTTWPSGAFPGRPESWRHSRWRPRLPQPWPASRLCIPARLPPTSPRPLPLPLS
jgi:uncharacterized protein YjiS (DUF1127 family)